jgi:Cu/Ag efflux protein CusF
MFRAARVLRSLLLVATPVLATTSVACGGADDGTEGQPVREATGEIKALSDDGKTATIAHEKIEGFMDAMTMDFELPDPKLAEGLVVGDRVDFSFQMNREGKMLVRSITKR